MAFFFHEMIQKSVVWGPVDMRIPTNDAQIVEFGENSKFWIAK